MSEPKPPAYKVELTGPVRAALGALREEARSMGRFDELSASCMFVQEKLKTVRGSGANSGFTSHIPPFHYSTLAPG
jgi:hypothetical protein